MPSRARQLRKSGLEIPNGSGTSSRAIRRRLLRWFGQHGRSFVWRSWRDPYRLLVTEVLLRQTRAGSVAVMVNEFFQIFPDPDALAAAGPELEATLRPLGFATQRAGQLRALAQHLVSADSSRAALDWSSLPGIGRYSSGMVAAVLGVRGAVAVDTNIARVIQRLYGVRPSHLEPRKSTNIWSLTSQLTDGPKSSIRVLWALLDLASAICKANNPDCPACPLKTECCYFKSRGNDLRSGLSGARSLAPTSA